MTDRWQQIEKLYQSALELDEPSRNTFLDEACLGDEELRRHVEALLQHHPLAQSSAEEGLLKTPLHMDRSEDATFVGQYLGHYKIISPLGAGGMGEVYRAQDSKLHREVALKVLPEVFAQDTERVARFQREAHILASLNQTNIAAIYGLEESNGVHALVTELVEGVTLAERIRHGPIPIDEALPIARQIAEALEYAHEKGIIHRDLKTANVKLTPEGMVKVLDFGLAIALEGGSAKRDLENAPTAAAVVTESGMVLGTAAYMAPEQARGGRVDRRADIWSFGVVLYEMLTGKRLFGRETVSDTLAAVLKEEPDWQALPEATPPGIQRLLRRCLTKDRRERLQAIGDARIEIREALSTEAELEVARPKSIAYQRRREQLAWALTAILAIFLTAAMLFWWRVSRPTSKPLVRLDAELEPELVDGRASVILSPDGGRLVYTGRSLDGKSSLYTRLLSQERAVAVAGTENGYGPFFSPDGQSIGFFAGSKLKKISVQGGEAVSLCDASSPRGGRAA
jgi:serine/threonine-protein kinase